MTDRTPKRLTTAMNGRCRNPDPRVPSSVPTGAPMAPAEATRTRESRTTRTTMPFHGQGRLRDQPLLPLPGACAATDLGSLSIGIQTALPPPRSERDRLERRYVRAVLGRYLWLPDTPDQSRRHDRHLACQLFERGVPLLEVEAALLLAATRRALREPWLAPLPRVRSLHYYLPVIAEILENPREPDLEYLTCLLRRLRPLAELKAARLAHEARYGSQE